MGPPARVFCWCCLTVALFLAGCGGSGSAPPAVNLAAGCKAGAAALSGASGPRTLTELRRRAATARKALSAGTKATGTVPAKLQAPVDRAAKALGDLAQASRADALGREDALAALDDSAAALKSAKGPCADRIVTAVDALRTAHYRLIVERLKGTSSLGKARLDEPGVVSRHGEYAVYQFQSNVAEGVDLLRSFKAPSRARGAARRYRAALGRVAKATHPVYQSLQARRYPTASLRTLSRRAGAADRAYAQLARRVAVT